MGKTQHPPMSPPALAHPRDALFEPSEPAPVPLPVCDHYAGVELRMRKSLELQAELGPVFDVTLDGEDGAPVGGEIEHAHLMAELVGSAANRYGRVGVRLQAVDHPRFEEVVDLLVGRVGARLPYLMLPKPRGVADIERAATCIDDSRAQQAHLIAIAHVENLTESSVLHDEEPRADSEGAKVGIENDGGGHGVIVLGKRAHVNGVAVSGRSQFCQHR